MEKGLFISLEGGEGAGKSSLMKYIEKIFLDKGRQVLCTREPGGTPLGELLRSTVLDKREGVAVGERAELLIFLASRAQQVHERIRPALERGEVVICDRFHDSTIAYQGRARGLGIECVEDLCLWSAGGLQPDKTFFLDVSPDLGLERAGRLNEKDRIEGAGMAFHEEVRQGFLRQAERYPERVLCIDASLPLEKVCLLAREALEPVLKNV